MIRLKAKQAEKEAEEKKAAEEAAAFNAGDNAGVSVPKPKTKILGVGRGKRSGISKEKRRTPGEIRIQKGAILLITMAIAINLVKKVWN